MVTIAVGMVTVREQLETDQLENFVMVGELALNGAVRSVKAPEVAAVSAYPPIGPDGIKKCPRRVGIVPSSRATFHCADAELLKTLSFECIIVDESHNARRQNLGPGRDAEKPDPNNLLAYLYEMSTRTKSMLLATASPIQLRPVEAWDLLDILSRAARPSSAACGATGAEPPTGLPSSWGRTAPERRPRHVAMDPHPDATPVRAPRF